jgi:hypothetical protein
LPESVVPISVLHNMKVHRRSRRSLPELEEERSPPPAAITDRHEPKVGKTSSPHRPDAVGLNRVKNQAPERPDYEALASPYGANVPGLSATVPSVALDGGSTVVHPSKNKRSGLESIHTSSLSQSWSLIQARRPQFNEPVDHGEPRSWTQSTAPKTRSIPFSIGK